ncbi:acetoacetate decarboxylase family protein [Patulibacter minatonensis]|uniref:acetoacetate decarboxylase family protein n=1 Tax=Patulibacter minatonensis TaxID=298163 RepID=UPI0004B564B7|nr:acetoacetate decarboxylase family protein [Patulibacter minatonensis]
MSIAAASTVDVASRVAYPPEPWQLGGSMLMTLWRVPAADVRREAGPYVPEGVRLATAGRHALLFTAFVRYTPGSVLSYDELLIAAPGTRGVKPVAVIPHIWVDSPASKAGGRELWGIPKGLAEFEQSWDGPIVARAAVDGTELASVRAAQGLRVPGWRRLPMPTAQRLDGHDAFADVQSLGRLHLGSAAWSFPDDSPLAFIGRGRPLVTSVLRQMTIRFGPSTRTPS